MTLPQGWVQTTLGEVAEFIMGQAPPGEDCNAVGVGTPFVKAGEFGPKRPIIREWTTKPLKTASTADVLICVVGATAGKINLGADCAIGRSVAAIRPGAASTSDFIYPRMKLEVQKLRKASTGTAQGVISREILAQVATNLPPLAEQRRIVAKLDKLTARIGRARAELERTTVLSARLRIGALRIAFSPANVAGWRKVLFSEIISDGLIGLVRSKEEQSNSGLPYIRMNHFDLDGRWNDDKLTRVSCTADELARYELRTGDVLFNTRNSTELVGKVAIWHGHQGRHVYNNNLLRLRFKKYACPEFMFLYMSSPAFRDELQNFKSATTSVAAVYQRDLYSLKIPIPDIQQQTPIVLAIKAAFARADRLEAEAARATALLDRLEASILAKAFRGELVPQDPADEPASVLLDRVRAERAAAPKARRGRGTVGHVEVR